VAAFSTTVVLIMSLVWMISCIEYENLDIGVADTNKYLKVLDINFKMLE